MSDSDDRNPRASELRLAALERKPVDPPVQNRSFTAREGQCFVVEPPAAGITATLVPASVFNKGARIQFFQKNANKVTLRCIKGKVNGAPFVVSNAPGFFEAISDGQTGWTVPQSIHSGGRHQSGRSIRSRSERPEPAQWARRDGQRRDHAEHRRRERHFPWAPANASSVVFAKLQNLTGLSVLGRAANSAGVMAAITAGGAAQYLPEQRGRNLALEFGDPASASVVNTGGTFQRAALTGAVTAAQNSNTTAFGALSALSVLANATNASAVPAALAGTAAFQHLRVNAAGTGLEWSVLTTAEFPSNVVPLSAIQQIVTDTFLGNISGVSSFPSALPTSAG